MPTASTDLNYPSVQIVERAFQPGASNTPSVSTIAAFIGKSNQGPTTPTLVSSWAQFTAVYGTTYTDLHNAVNDYFNNGGQFAYVDRIAGSGATTGSVNIYASDAPEDPQNPGSILPGTPALFTATALNPGAWANRIVVAVYARDTVNKRFDLAIYNVPSGVSFDPTKRNSDLLLESWIDVTLDRSDTRYLYDVVNSPSSTGSVYITLSGQSYDPSTPSVKPYPATVSGKSLAGGADGSYLSPFDPIAAYNAAILDMQQVPQPYVLNIPNVNDATIIKYAATTAAARGDIFVIIDPPQGLTPNDAVTYASTTLGLSTIATNVPSYAALYYPWVYMPTVGASTPGKLSLRPAGGAIAGLMMAIDNTYGPWKTPAGTKAGLSGAVDIERKMTESDLSKLNNANVNAIRNLPGQGVVVMGGRTMKVFGLDRYISTRRSLIYLREQLRQATQFAIFEPNAQPLWTKLTNVCNGICGKFWQSGGLSGLTTAQAFYVKCDSTNNTSTSQQNGVVNIEVGVALAAPAEFIVITIGQFDGGSSSVSTSV